MPLFTLTINNLSPAMDRQNHEVTLIHKYLELAIQDVRGAGGKKTSGNITDNLGNAGGTVVVGSWAYTPQAAS
jgi:hypothetical protein